MALKEKLETLEGLDEALHSLYIQPAEGGAYFLDIEDISEHPKIQSLKTTHLANTSKLTESQGRIKALEAAVEAAKGAAPDQIAIAAMRAEIEKDRDEAIARAAALESQVYGLTAARQLQEAIANAGIVEPAFQKGAMAILNEGNALQIIDGAAMVKTVMGDIPLQDHVNRWVANDGKVYVSPAKGGGANGDSGQGSKNINPIAAMVPAFADLPVR